MMNFDRRTRGGSVANNSKEVLDDLRDVTDRCRQLSGSKEAVVSETFRSIYQGILSLSATVQAATSLPLERKVTDAIVMLGDQKGIHYSVTQLGQLVNHLLDQYSDIDGVRTLCEKLSRVEQHISRS